MTADPPAPARWWPSFGWLPAELGHPLDTHPEPRSVRDWIVDVNLFLICGGIAALLWMYIDDVAAPQVPQAMIWADMIFGAPCVLAIWWRRRWPTRIALLMVPIAVFSSVAAVPALVMVYTVAVRRSLRTVAIVTALHLAAVTSYAFVRPERETSLYFTITLGVLGIAGALAWGLFGRARRQLILSLRDRAERAESERNLLLEQARQSERTRIAREMHDVLGHRISLISLHAGALEFRADKAGPEVAESAAVIRASAHQALQDLREVIGVLRAGSVEDPPDRPQPTLADLPDLVEESRRAGMRVSFSCSQASLELSEGAKAPALIGRTAYRIVQEGLTNARKHAPATAVTVTVTGGPGVGLEVSVRNRPPLTAPVELSGAGQGLVGLTERVTLADGKLEHGWAPEGDFRLDAWLPWPATGEDQALVPEKGSQEHEPEDA